MLVGAKWPTNPIGVFKNAATQEEETKEIIRTEEVRKEIQVTVVVDLPDVQKDNGHESRS